MEGRLLITLPTSLVADVLNKWLSVSDRVRIDSAHCSSSVREDFLQLLRSPELAIRVWVYDKEIYGIAKETTDNVVRWANMREILVAGVSIGKDSDAAVYNSFLKRRGQNVLTVKARSTSIVDLTAGLSQCHNLEVLNIYNCEISPSLRSVLEHCQSLRIFLINFWDFSHIHGGKHGKFRPGLEPRGFSIKASDLQGLVCPSLKYLKIESCQDGALIAALVKTAVNVDALHFCFHGTQQSLCSTFDNMNPGLKALALTAETEVQEVLLMLETAQMLVNRFSSLVHLSLRRCNLTVPIIRELGNLRHLCSLDIASCMETTDDILAPLADACCDKLTELLLCQNYGLSLGVVQEVLPRFTKLTSFSMHYDGEDYAIFDFSQLARFTTLSVFYDGKGGSDFVRDLAHHCPKQLQHFHFQLFDMDADMEEFLAEDMDALVSMCTKLRSLHLAGNMGPVHDSEDVARWQGMRPNLVVSNVVCTEQLSVFRDLEECDV